MGSSVFKETPLILEKILKGIVIGISIIFIIFILMSVFRVGLVFWFYDRVFGWVSTRLGLDYYLALFIALSVTAIFSAMYPYLLWTFVAGRYKLPTTIAIIAASGLMCLLVYTVGGEVYFDRLTGQPLKWFADTPDGRVFSNSPGYDKKYGIKLKPFTADIAQHEVELKQKAAEDSHREAEVKEKLKEEEVRAGLERLAEERRVLERQQQEQAAREEARKAAAKWVLKPTDCGGAYGLSISVVGGEVYQNKIKVAILHNNVQGVDEYFCLLNPRYDSYVTDQMGNKYPLINIDGIAAFDTVSQVKGYTKIVKGVPLRYILTFDAKNTVPKILNFTSTYYTPDMVGILHFTKTASCSNIQVLEER